MNQAIHTLDLVQWFVGPVTDVRGTVATLALADAIEVEDTAALRLQHRTVAGDTVPSVFHATNGHVENRHVRAGKHFWIDAPAALETLRVIQAAYDQTPGLGRG